MKQKRTKKVNALYLSLGITGAALVGVGISSPFIFKSSDKGTNSVSIIPNTNTQLQALLSNGNGIGDATKTMEEKMNALYAQVDQRVQSMISQNPGLVVTESQKLEILNELMPEDVRESINKQFGEPTYSEIDANKQLVKASVTKGTLLMASHNKNWSFDPVDLIKILGASEGTAQSFAAKFGNGSKVAISKWEVQGDEMHFVISKIVTQTTQVTTPTEGGEVEEVEKLEIVPMHMMEAFPELTKWTPIKFGYIDIPANDKDEPKAINSSGFTFLTGHLTYAPNRTGLYTPTAMDVNTYDRLMGRQPLLPGETHNSILKRAFDLRFDFEDLGLKFLVGTGPYVTPDTIAGKFLNGTSRGARIDVGFVNAGPFSSSATPIPFYVKLIGERKNETPRMDHWGAEFSREFYMNENDLIDFHKFLKQSPKDVLNYVQSNLPIKLYGFEGSLSVNFSATAPAFSIQKENIGGWEHINKFYPKNGGFSFNKLTVSLKIASGNETKVVELVVKSTNKKGYIG